MNRKSDIEKTTDWHFPDGTIGFLSDLRVHNNREWFAGNKRTYEEAFKRPAIAFCALMTAELEDLTGTPHRSKIFRIHRDVRFSKDKTPYNTHLHISFFPNVGPEGLAWFFGLEPGSLVLGAGTFAFDKPALETYRQRLVGPDGEPLRKALSDLRKNGARLNEPELKRVPPGYPADHRHSELLRRKGLAVWLDHPEGANAATRPDIIQTCTAEFQRLKPVFDWLFVAD